MKTNKGLLDKKRFEWMEKSKIEFLRNLTIRESVRILEELTSPEILNEFIDNFSSDTPLCLLLSLKRRRK